jgi:ribose transport system permease protein
LSPRRIGAVYVWIVAIIAFSIANPGVFPTADTAKGITSQYAVPGLAAVAIIPSLACGAFDVSIGANIGLTGMVFAVLHANHPGLPLGVVIVLVMLVGVLIALANIIAVVVLEIDSFIGTLAMAAILDAIATAISHGQFIPISVNGAWSSVATGEFLGISMPFWYLIVAVIAIGYWLERTTSGRYMYATGFDRETSRLTGVPVTRLRAAGYLTSGLLGAFTGMVYATVISSSSPGHGDAFLIPAFSAAFLGATQFRPGRFNTAGTLVGVLALATVAYGITIAGGPAWSTQLFEGLILLVAIGVGKVGGQRLMIRRRPGGSGRSPFRRLRGRPRRV